MTYSLDFRMQVLKSLDEGMTFAEKTTRQTKPYKIPDDVLLNDVQEHPDDYQYERARRLNCSKTDIYHALKRLGISQKKDLRASKSLPNKKSGVSGKV